MIYLDIETNLAHDKIWCVVTKDEDGLMVWTEDSGLDEYLKDKQVCAHNLIGFDAKVLREVWGISIPLNKAVDTLVMSRLYDPNVEGGHSLKAWGKRLGFDKMDFDVEDFDGGLTEEMLDYCTRDVEVLERLHKHLVHEMGEGWEQSLALEHEVAMHMARQERTGFKLNVEKASKLLAELRNRMVEIEMQMQRVFPPIVTERWSEKTGKRLKDHVEEFNVGSRQQIAKRLESLGVKFTERTEKGQVIVNEKVLDGIDLPEAKLINEYLMLQKRVGLVDAWLDRADADGRVHGRVISNGAVTGRMTHQNPNLGQVPSVNSPYGKECRSCWTVDDGNVLVGTDLSGIELRCLAHYMQDDNYTKELLDGDIHTANQHAAGLETRAQAKTFIYALLYGAGAAKIGAIAGGNAKKGQELIDKFMGNTPKLQQLLLKVQRIASKGYVPALDGRKIRIRSEHAALNSLLQSCGAIIAKQWCVEAHRMLRRANIPVKQVAFVHDEIQMEVPAKYGQTVADIMTRASIKAGNVLGFRIPAESESKIGKTWLDTH
jgi:DNA polymerase I-like protein with 3'-5' exonuclease and polymerase domains